MAQESINDVTPFQLDDSNNCEWNYVWDPNLCKTTLKLITSKVYTPPVLPSSSIPKEPSRDRYYVCHFDGCNRTFAKDYASWYKTHLQRHLPDCERPFQCDYPECTRGFVKQREFETHKRSHTGEKPYKCEQCGMSFYTPSHLKRHVKSHIKLLKTKKKLLIKARLEKASCSSDPNDDVEMQEETDESEMSSDSESSDESDSSKPKNKPPTEKKHKCPEEGCGEAFRCASLLMRHSLTHSGHKPYKCDKCGKGFMRPDYLTKHLKAHLNNPKFRPFKCNHPDCTKRFVKNDELVSHMQTHTQSNKLHKCEKCNKTFRRINFLNKHMQVHKLEGEGKNVPSEEAITVGNVPSEEDSAGVNVASEEVSAGVDADKTTDLEGEKKHKCPVEGCGEAFRFPLLLERHTYMHSGHKPLECYKCGKGFFIPYYLNKHLKAHLKKGKNVSSDEEVSGDDDSDNTSDSESNYILSSLIPTKLNDKIEEEEAHKNEEHHDHEMKELEVKQEKIEDAFFSSIAYQIRVIEDLVHDIKEKKVDPYDLKQEIDTKTDMEQFRIIEDLLHEIKEENDEPHSVKEEINTTTDMQQLRIIEDLLNEIKKENVDEIHDVKQEMDTKIDGHQLQMIEDLLRKMKEEKDEPHDLKQESEVEKQTDVHQLRGVLEDLLYEVKEDEVMTVKREPLDRSMDF
ncbi:zinc finger protein 91-like [Episyrphus balteatus]|uniref:zinc finger protein 91-like n=1 Tax=Episyrphus balteatus TaxID=286459 RepID=UPI002486594E|nr:zinc finger protein 91-like [Episyrphus balteatus]XP_055851265.1 zinc finger protein 91-like [Episyrphus balteatus]